MKPRDAQIIFYRRLKGNISKLVIPDNPETSPTITFSYEEDGGTKTRWCYYNEKYFDTLEKAIKSNLKVSILITRYLLEDKENNTTVIEEWIDDMWIES